MTTTKTDATEATIYVCDAEGGATIREADADDLRAARDADAHTGTFADPRTGETVTLDAEMDDSGATSCPRKTRCSSISRRRRGRLHAGPQAHRRVAGRRPSAAHAGAAQGHRRRRRGRAEGRSPPHRWLGPGVAPPRRRIGSW